MKSFKELKEEVLETTNSAGAGNVAGLPPDSPPGPRKKKKYVCRREVFAGMDVFEVNLDTYLRCRGAKGRYDRYVKHVGDDDTGQAIREFGLTNPGRAIILKDEKHGNMTFLRYGKTSAIRRSY